MRSRFAYSTGIALLVFLAGCPDEPPATADAGMDAASLIDAAFVDAAETDAAIAMDAPHDAGVRDAGSGERDAEPVDAAAPVDAPLPDAAVLARVDVGHERELRAMWAASVFRLDFPSREGLSAAQARAELTTIVDAVAAAGMNAVLFQVRPESDALYASTLEPWSRFLTGTQGADPGYDPLALLLEVAHPRGVEVHAWMNPYRALTSTSTAAAPNHVTRRFPGAVVTYGSAVVMDPSSAAVRAHIVAVVRDIVTHYDVDGVVFDDYFYPYPISGVAFPDDAPYAAYVGAGGTSSRSDWRRDNVNALVAAVGVELRTTAPWVRWGIAPFGIYRPGMPPGVSGLDSYEVLAADSVRWLSEGWIDYLAPQLYWTSTSTGQPFGPLVDWWAARATPLRPIVPSLALYRLGSSPEWTLDELERQVDLTRAQTPSTAGQTWFRQGFLGAGMAAVARVYGTPARPPVVPELSGTTIDVCSLSWSGTDYIVAHPDPANIRGFGVYADRGAGWVFTSFVPGSSARLAPSAERRVVTAFARGSVESRGVELPPGGGT